MTSERIKEIQELTAYPKSWSVKQALLQVWNECEQEQLRLLSVSHRRELLAKYTKWQGEYYQREEDMYADIDKFLNGL